MKKACVKWDHHCKFKVGQMLAEAREDTSARGRDWLNRSEGVPARGPMGSIVKRTVCLFSESLRDGKKGEEVCVKRGVHLFDGDGIGPRAGRIEWLKKKRYWSWRCGGYLAVDRTLLSSGEVA
jgi:hypothetical protein